MPVLYIHFVFIAQDIYYCKCRWVCACTCLHPSPIPLNPTDITCHHTSRILCGIMGRRPRRPNLKLCAMRRRRSLEGTANNACFEVFCFCFLSLRFIFCLCLCCCTLQWVYPFWVMGVTRRSRCENARRDYDFLLPSSVCDRVTLRWRCKRIVITGLGLGLAK